MREPCVSVSYTHCKKDEYGHVPGGPFWMLTWLPKGYGPSMEDRLICGFFDTDDRWNDRGLKDGRLPPLIEVARKAMEDHLKAHPEDIAGHLVNYDGSSLELTATAPVRRIAE